MLNRLELLCKFAFQFSNMDTIFLDTTETIQLEFGLTTTPEPLLPYFSRIIKHMNLFDSTLNDVLFHSNSYRLNFISAKVTNGDEDLGRIVVGPYLLEEPTILMIESIISDNKMAISLKNMMKEYYLTLPIMSTKKAKSAAEFLSYLVSTFHYYDPENSKIGTLFYEFQTADSVPLELIKENTDQAVEKIEKRYRKENEMLYAVESGNIELYNSILTENKSIMISILDRVPNDPLRSIKNNGFVLNTLLRKAAEKGGVHPIYLDSLSSKFAVQIEKCSSMLHASELFRSMQYDYCDAVRKLSLKNYSSAIRRAIEYIRMNLNQDLSLDSISGSLNLNSYELSRQFKKETGKNITEYINNRRINEALYILENDNISITDVAFTVGFNDVNYFTKVFKKLKGITPSEYRKQKS
ncbi:helix-turn-helix domain-containing protein [Neobacillus sp. 179-C4.2 HS]|uniref:Helix-turn-helix domain-containing protein n=1 Tax=Neobacillus driksii TaxID=3035913 RepID=A0ABV4YVH3_9BACI|nr:AraC family transcriptional regulator [Neobacillus sp. 179.-C4.2 HS]MDP5192660.1 helix-turn-helix domain-containing protein [Neobacillus sp. 179.-C4.2 HS]